MVRSIRTIRRSWTHVAAAGALLLAGCSGEHARSPVDPGPAPTLGSATIAGDVRAGSAPAAGVEVTVDGQAISARTDGSGRFELDGVAAGDRVLTFATDSARAPVPVRDVRSDERIEMQVALSGGRATVTGMQRGPRGSTAPLGVEVHPDGWSANWARSSGTVTVFLRGDGYDRVDPASVTLVGDDPAEPPLLATRARVEGEHLKAQFGKSAALGLLLEPLARGETRTIAVEFTLDGVPSSLSASVRIVGP